MSSGLPTIGCVFRFLGNEGAQQTVIESVEGDMHVVLPHLLSGHSQEMHSCNRLLENNQKHWPHSMVVSGAMS